MNRDITENQRFWTPPDIGTRELGEVVRGRKKAPRGARRIKEMKYTKPQKSSANCSRPGPTVDDSDAARQRIQTALGKAFGLLDELGAFDDIAVMFQANPLSAELAFRDDLFGMGRNMLGKAFEAFTDQGPTLEVEGENYRKVAPSNGQAITVIGPVGFSRPRYRPTSGQGESFIPTEHTLGLTVGDLTPAAAGLGMSLASSLTVRESADTWKRFTGEKLSVSTLVRLCGEAGRCLEECSTEVMDELRKQEELPENASMVQISLDGVMMRMIAEKNGDEVIEKKGWREAACGTVTLRDEDGNRLLSRYIGRLPEGKKKSLKTQIRQELDHLRSQNPDLKLVVTADGEWGNWTFSETLNPDVEVLDFWHAIEKLMVAAEAAFGSDEKAKINWFKAKRHILRHDPKGFDKVMDALRYQLRKEQGCEESCEEIRKVLGYFRNNRRRMNYYHLAEEGYPIGSGEVEAANKMLVTHRLKRSGQRWGRDGGQGVLAFRALLKSDRLDRAWSMIVPGMERQKKMWNPVKTPANDNWAFRDAA